MADYVGQQLGNYRLLRLLGQGSFAAVYLGEHLYLERLAAIKILHMQIEPETHEAFLREARTIAHLQHPHIIGVHDFGIEGQTPYLVMDYVPNGTLRTSYPVGTRLPVEQIIHYVKQIAAALDYAHEQYVIHRDVKPENLLLNARNEVVLSDFGIAVVQRTLSSLSEYHMAGTPLYMAPEQILGKPCAASDQYALGVMVYEWLCGEPPFRGGLYEIFNYHLHEPPPGLCARLPQLSPAVEDAIFGALAKDPRHRFVTVQDFTTVLEEAFLATQPFLLSVSTKHEVQEVTTRPLARVRPLPVPAPGGQDHSAIQPQPRTMQRSGEERVASVSPQPAKHGQSVSKRARPTLAQTNRQRLLRRVRAFWVTGVLEHSLHGATLVTLGLQAQPDAVANPWHLVLRHRDTAPRSLPAETRITQVYDAANGELLILGAPGSGKTTLLLELARDLLDRAERDEQHPMPVVFNLSSWATKQPPLVDWLVEELTTRYQVPPRLARTLVETDQILPLLDGLDEMDARVRTACIDAINTYRSMHGLLPLVVCSRSADYLEQAARIQLDSAVTLQPLSSEQIEAYLEQVGEPADALRVALYQDAELREMASTPLMLSILTATFQGRKIDTLILKGVAPTRQQVFEQYIERMLAWRGGNAPYSPEQVRTWLTWLARQLLQHRQAVFYIEHLQPDWLSDQHRRRVYDWLAIRLPGTLMGLLVSFALSFITLDPSSRVAVTLLSGLLGWLLSGGSASQQPLVRNEGKPIARLLKQLGVAVVLGLGVWLSSGPDGEPLSRLLTGLSFGICCFLLMVVLPGRSNTIEVPAAPHPPEGTKPRHPVRRMVIRNGLLVGLLLGLSGALSASISDGLIARLSLGLIFALLGGLIGGLVSALLVGKSTAVQLTDRLVWTWKSLGRSFFSKRHVRPALQVAAIGGLSVGIIVWLRDTRTTALIFGLSFGLIFGLSYWLLLGIFQGVASKTIEDQQRVVPNQGIRHSALNSLTFGLGVTVCVGVSSGLVFGGMNWPMVAGVGLTIGLNVGLLAGLQKGGLACLRHYILRVLLWRSGVMPWNYARFLDYAAERILLRKVGGGYIFLHRLLLDYFAHLNIEAGSDGSSAESKPLSNTLLPALGTSTRAYEYIDVPTLTLAPTPSDRSRLLPCGHERRSAHARFCSVCGAPVSS